LGTNHETFSKPAVGIIHREGFVDVHQLLLDDELTVFDDKRLVPFLLLIQSNAEYGAASAIAFNENTDCLGRLLDCFRNGLEGLIRNLDHKCLLLGIPPRGRGVYGLIIHCLFPLVN